MSIVYFFAYQSIIFDLFSASKSMLSLKNDFFYLVNIKGFQVYTASASLHKKGQRSSISRKKLKFPICPRIIFKHYE